MLGVGQLLLQPPLLADFVVGGIDQGPAICMGTKRTLQMNPAIDLLFVVPQTIGVLCDAAMLQ